jgi:hypothetical protein
MVALYHACNKNPLRGLKGRLKMTLLIVIDDTNVSTSCLPRHCLQTNLNNVDNLVCGPLSIPMIKPHNYFEQGQSWPSFPPFLFHG